MHSVACVISGKPYFVICAVMQSPLLVSLHMYCLLVCKRDIVSVHTYFIWVGTMCSVHNVQLSVHTIEETFFGQSSSPAQASSGMHMFGIH